ncbi:spectrin repeat superfamily protein, Extracellular matrix-binding protein, putative [Babesia caballi]|uniref:Spectrin repeat superfamily protein, Extracellular matrix-binding protein, putative n=1 Tax=Babesia caballi TaxID=5871 RepID=A0AAV4M3C5_BABCB|nr:spectrin repeat superfamily protein, Extracellular matrix-binding protein, putative [Babesia caballi]
MDNRDKSATNSSRCADISRLYLPHPNIIVADNRKNRITIATKRVQFEILRVTGKDGKDQNSRGPTAIEALNTQVKELFKEVKTSDSTLSEDIENVIGALDTGGSDGLITKLADGLQQFIGYEDKGGGKIKADIGIAVSNLPLERLRDAVLMFIGPLLGVLRGYHPDLKIQYATQLGEDVEACKKGVGCGQRGFEKALQTVEKELGQVRGRLGSGDKKRLG